MPANNVRTGSYLLFFLTWCRFFVCKTRSFDYSVFCHMDRKFMSGSDNWPAEVLDCKRCKRMYWSGQNYWPQWAHFTLILCCLADGTKLMSSFIYKQQWKTAQRNYISKRPFCKSSFQRFVVRRLNKGLVAMHVKWEVRCTIGMLVWDIHVLRVLYMADPVKSNNDSIGLGNNNYQTCLARGLWMGYTLLEWFAKKRGKFFNKLQTAVQFVKSFNSGVIFCRHPYFKFLVLMTVTSTKWKQWEKTRKWRKLFCFMP